MPEHAELEDISVFDTASYVNQLTTELSRMAREGGLDQLADTLEAARDLSAQAMLEIKRTGRA